MEKRKLITKKNGVLAGIVIIALMLILHAALIYDQKISDKDQEPKDVFQVNGDINSIIGEIEKDRDIVQTITGVEMPISSVKLVFGTYERENNNILNISFENKDTNEVIEKWQVKASEIVNNEDFRLDFEHAIDLEASSTYLIRISTPDGEAGNSVTAYKTSRDIYRDGRLFLGGEEQRGDLKFSLCYGTKTFMKGLYLFVFAGLFVLLALLGYLCFFKKCKIERIFAVTALMLGILYMVVLPPFSAPDEPSHAYTSYYYSNKMMFQQGTDEKGQILVRKGDQLLNRGNIYTTEYVYGVVWDHFFEMNTENGTEAVADAFVLGAPVLTYIPQAIGITLARILHFGCVPLFFMGRLFALLFYILCGYFAIKKIPFGKMVVFFVALLPISIEVAASFSYDSVINGCAFLFIGYTLYLAFDKEKVQIKDWILLALLMAVLAPSKIVYVFLGLLCILIPKAKAVSKKKYSIGMGIVAAGAIIPLIISRISTIGNYLYRDTNTVSYAGKPGFTVGGLLSMPMALIRLVYDSFKTSGTDYLNMQLGGKLGWLNLNIPWNIIICFLIILLLSCIMGEKEKLYVNGRTRAVFISVAGIVIMALMGVFLLTWTPVDSPVIRGVQGRYFTPVLPLLLISMRSRNLTFKKNIDYYLIIGWCVLQFYTIWTVFELIIS